MTTFAIRRAYMAAFEKLSEDLQGLPLPGGNARIVVRFDLMIDGIVVGETETIRGDIRLRVLEGEPQQIYNAHMSRAYGGGDG